MNPLKHKNFVFHYPAITIGGAQLLFARVAEKLILNGYKVTFLGRKSYFIPTYLSEKNLAFSCIEADESKPYEAKSDDFFILSLSDIISFKTIINPHYDSHFLFWDLHPHAVLENLSFSKFYKDFEGSSWIEILKKMESTVRKKIKNYLEIGHQKNGVFFMCYRNFLTNKAIFSIDISPSYLPLPITISENSAEYEKNLQNICWISRLDKDKTIILELLINDVIQYNQRNKTAVKLHIIGDGSDFEFVKKNIQGYEDFFVLCGVLSGENLSEYLKQHHISVGFAMGTSALEFASRNIAVSLVPSTSERKLYENHEKRYLWLSDSYGFDVAVESFHSDDPKISSFEDIMQTSKDKANLCWQYVHQHHLDEKVFNILLENIQKNQFTFADISKTEIFEGDNLHTVLNKFKKIYKRILSSNA